MTQDEIIKMAWDSGAYTHRITAWGFSLENLERFAAAIAAKEREACAKVCEQHPDGMTMLGGAYVACAKAIRARGEA
jgi:hypothetical protein